MTDLILYEHPLSPYAQKVKIALAEKGVAFETRLPTGIGSGSVPDPDFTSGNPRLEVPLLLATQEPGAEPLRIFDSTVMLEYIEDRYPEPALLPPDPGARARTRMLEDVMDTHYEAINWGLAEIRYFGRAKGEQAEAIEARATSQLGALHAWLEDELGTASWFGGETFGWGDLAVVPFVNGASGFGLGPEPQSRLGAWQARANARPSVTWATEAAAAAASGMEGVAELVETGAFKRQYRDHRLEWMIRSGGFDVVARGLERGNIRFTERWG